MVMTLDQAPAPLFINVRSAAQTFIHTVFHLHPVSSKLEPIPYNLKQISAHDLNQRTSHVLSKPHVPAH